MKRKCILLVDDNAELRRLLRLTLDDGSYDIHEAMNGMNALHLARALVPDIMILDVMMSGELDGLQVCEILRQEPRLAALYIVLLTARGQTADRAAGLKAGANAYLSKPFSPLELYQLIKDGEAAHAHKN
jgi:two-component system phosphate regulon response regulator PhoB